VPESVLARWRDEEDKELLISEEFLYTQRDPGYQAELKRTCPPHPLFVLKWNRNPNGVLNNSFNRHRRGGGDQRPDRNNQHQNHAQQQQKQQQSSSNSNRR